MVWLTRVAVLCLALTAGATAKAQDGPFAPGWTLQSDQSSLRVQSVKKQTVVESSTFASFSGAIASDGTATIDVKLDSIDTKIDLRNVRMRFLFFETFTYPDAHVTLKIDPGQVADLATKRRLTLTLPFTLDLHGVSVDRTAEVAVTMISPDLISVSSMAPVVIQVADHNLAAGLQKLQEAANVDIIPSGSITFDFLFAREGAPAGDQMAKADTAKAADTAVAKSDSGSAALEAKGDFDPTACRGRFEILSRSGNIFFRTGSATLDKASDGLLGQVADIVSRCPGMVIEIGGYTDSDGSDAANQTLSERRARSVADYLAAHGIPGGRFETKGYGEADPFLPNDSAEHKARNRRIEFKVVSG